MALIQYWRMGSGVRPLPKPPVNEKSQGVGAQEILSRSVCLLREEMLLNCGSFSVEFRVVNFFEQFGYFAFFSLMSRNIKLMADNYMKINL